MKKCGRCNVEKEDDCFSKRSRNKQELKSYCKPCEVEVAHVCHQKNKIAAFKNYGGVFCSCCGVSEICFLSLDHVDDNGSFCRSKHGSGTTFYQWLKRNNYPADLNLRVLCHNCNHGREINGGICPHEISKRDYC